jgi:peptide/nickel transport system permease protein
VSGIAQPLTRGSGPSVRPAGSIRRWRPRGLVRRALRTPRGRIGATLTVAIVLLAAIGPFVAPHAANEFVTTPFAKPGGDALLGGDVLGRDVLSRMLNGGWKLLLMAGGATILGVMAGALIGIAAAFYGGRTDGVLMRTMDVVLAFPQIVFALLLVSIVGAKLWLIVLAVAIIHAPQVARVIRASALDVCERDFVRASELIALPARRVMTGEILPNVMSPLMVELGLRMAYSIIIMAGLSFLGFGLQPPDPNWGAMLNENRVGISANAWGIGAPATLLALLTVGLNVFTDALARASLGVDRASDAVDDQSAQLLLTEAVAND